MFGNLKERLKKNLFFSAVSHRAYYGFLKRRDAFRRSPKRKKLFDRFYATGLYSSLQMRTEPSVSAGDKEKRKRIWAFNAGNTFTGNPKWTFVYINRYRKDIDAYWICDSEKTVKYVKGLGYKAYTFHSAPGIAMQKKTGVFCVEQVKEVIPAAMPDDVVLLNLYHGVGCKTVEKKVDSGFLAERIARKYIINNEYYMTHMLFLVTSPLMEEHFIKQIGLKREQLIRAGYPRCIYQGNYEDVKTFDHDILAKKGLPENTTVVAYVPTYRDSEQADFWPCAVPDMHRLIGRLEEENMLLIFKLHPQMLRDPQFKRIKKEFGKEKRLYFWDNSQDFYEILDRIDVGIVDYSSIFYDLLAAKVPHFIRYFYDYDRREQDLRSFVFDLKEMTCGELCMNFEELLMALGKSKETDTEAEAQRNRIMDLFWHYSDSDSMERIVQAALDFEPPKKSDCPVLYSFDIFDTLIARKVLDPKGIFYAVQYRMAHADTVFDERLLEAYPQIRMWCESNVREYYAKSMVLRKSDRREITFEMIFERMGELYPLTQQQKKDLMDWELEAEYENCIPCTEYLGLLEELVKRHENVWLISDMYLPEAFIVRLLEKVSPVAASLPLYLSSTLGVQKTTYQLYLKAYLLQDGNWPYARWIHYGDNPKADEQKAIEMGIEPRLHAVAKWNDYESELIRQLGSYDGYLAAAHFARFRMDNSDPKAYFAYAYVSPYFVPYVYFAVHDALSKGIKTLYFISRDGYQLKRIADAIIQAENLPVKTKYIYGSRKAWRIPSFIDEVDEDFFADHGNFSGVNSYKKLLDALLLTDERFVQLFPSLAVYRGRENIYKIERDEIARTVQESAEYHQYILSVAKEQRMLVDAYLKQEIDFSEAFAFVEYWGRGYTQTCFTRLLQHAAGDRELDDVFYYARSIYPSSGHDIRINFTCCKASMIFAEALFANIPYKSVEQYERTDEGRVEPVIRDSEYHRALFDAMEVYLPAFARHYAALPVLDRERMGKALYDFALTYLADHHDDPFLAEQFGSLKDAVTVSGGAREYAPKIDREMLKLLYGGVSTKMLTSSPVMSMARSDPKMAETFFTLKMEIPKIQKNEPAVRLAQDAEKKQRIGQIRKAQGDLTACRAAGAELMKRYEDLCRETSVDPLLVCVNMQDAQQGQMLAREMEQAGLITRMEAVSLSSPLSGDEKENCLVPGEALCLLAAAKYILVDAPSPLLTKMKLRKETKLLLFEENAFERDLSDAQEMYEDRKLRQYIRMNPFYAAAAGGPAHAALLQKRYPLLKEAVSCGLPAAQIYADERFTPEAKAQLEKAYPACSGRKIVCCLYDGRSGNLNALPDIGIMERMLSDSFFLIVSAQGAHWKEASAVPACYGQFAVDVSGVLTQRQMIACADALIGDAPILCEGLLRELPYYRIAPQGVFDPKWPGIAVTDTIALCEGLLRCERKTEKAFLSDYLCWCGENSCSAFVRWLKEQDEKGEGTK